MTAPTSVTNIVLAGLGGQGVLKASDILSEAAFLAGFDIKKSEIHGMSQRGGSVTSDVRYGAEVLSPMVPAGEAHYLLVLEPTQIENNLQHIAKGGMLIEPGIILGEAKSAKELDRNPDGPVNARNFNVAMLGLLSTYLDIPEEHWHGALKANLPAKVWEQNEAVFAYGRSRRNG